MGRITQIGREFGQLVDDLAPVLVVALAVIFAPALPWIIGGIAK